MIVDTSALIAILLNEPDAEEFEEALAESSSTAISVASALECSIVIAHKLGDAALIELDNLFRVAEITKVAVSETQFFIARAAYLRYGKGRHRAGLNFGDTFSYALAVDRDEELLFKGDDFGYTDVKIPTAA